MPLTDPLVLPPDVLVIPVHQLAATLRRRVAASDDDFAITRVRRRTNSKIVNADAAQLLERFRTPHLVSEIVRLHGRDRNLDPDELLTDIFPVLRDCFNAGFLVPADSPEARMIQPSMERGDRVGDFEILHGVQILEDTEVYQARATDGSLVALKLASPGNPAKLRSPFTIEARVLRRLGGKGAPLLLGQGDHEGLPYLAMTWQSGSSPAVAFGEVRGLSLSDGRARLLSLSVEILRAYAGLHARGIIHGDVQPNNILVDRDDGITLLDFGCSRLLRGPASPRGGVPFFFDPELARAELADRAIPLATARGEQYSLAALLYWLLCGEPYLDFSLDRQVMLSQIVTDRPLTFADRGRLAWPPVEQVLERALSKRPRDRFVSVTAFAAALERVLDEVSRMPTARGAMAGDRLKIAVEEMLTHCEPGGIAFREILVTAPTSSITFGAAGIAAALYRIAGVIQDPRSLAYADSWLARAEQARGESAFYNPDLDITPAVVGRISLYHTGSGIHCARALLGQAYGNQAWMRQGAEQYLLSSRGECQFLDLTLGRASTLIGCAMLLECLPPSAGAGPALRQLGSETMNEIWHAIDECGPIGSCAQIPNLGIAHGWAGLLYASLWWSRTARVPYPSHLEERLVQLAACGEEAGRGLAWPVIAADGEVSAPVPGWCNGSAGFIHLWTMAHSCFRSEQYLALAEQSAWSTWEAVETAPNLCCGAAGRVYGLLNLYRYTGDTAWLARARALGLPLVEGAIGLKVRTDAMSLYKGTAGVAVLAADLMRPELSSMPFFESEQWPRSGLAHD